MEDCLENVSDTAEGPSWTVEPTLAVVVVFVPATDGLLTETPETLRELPALMTEERLLSVVSFETTLVCNASVLD